MAVQAAPDGSWHRHQQHRFGTYVDTTTEQPSRLTSNTVNTLVSALEALTLATNQTVLVANGTSSAISHTLTNTGNATTTYLHHRQRERHQRVHAAQSAGGA